MLKVGMSLTLDKVVSSEETASQVASGALEVFSTPMLIAFMEETSFKLISKELSSEKSTVGMSVNIKHLKANLVGDKIRCTSTIKEVDGNKVTLNVDVSHNGDLVGTGEHKRYIIDIEKFINNLKK